MMEKEFNFEKVGKQMPYKVPSDFFDKITEETLTEAERRSGSKRKHSKAMLWTLSVAASITLLLGVGVFIYTGGPQEEELIAESAYTEAPVAAIPKAAALPAKSDTMTRPEPLALEQQLTVPAQPKNENESVPIKSELMEKQFAKADKEESFEDVLKSLSDDELLHMAALAESELYVYEETFSEK